MLKFYIRHGMIIEKVHEIISFKQSKWSEKYISFITKKKDLYLKMILKKIFIKY